MMSLYALIVAVLPGGTAAAVEQIVNPRRYAMDHVKVLTEPDP